METPLSTGPMRKAFWFMLVLVAAVVTLVELRLRTTGVAAAFDDGPPLWTNNRKQVYADPARTVVFIGSSPIKFDLDLELWEQLTGTRAVQLAFEGSNPRPGLSDLAADPQFRGRLVVDVTEGLFFSTSPPQHQKF